MMASHGRGRRVEVEVEVEVEVGASTVEFKGKKCRGIELQCVECGHAVKVAGESIRSYRRGYCLLAEQCPREEKNYYSCDDEPTTG
jgi:hypothetical protein